jgi:hypothetical protein
MNPSKTEEFLISKDHSEWKNSKKLGTLLGEAEEFQARKNKAEIVLNQCKVFWSKKHGMTTALKIRLFKVFIESTLLYNCGTWALNKKQLDSLDAFYRGMVRRVIGIFFPKKISCEALYQRTGIDRLGPKVAKARILLFGKILRGDDNSPGLFWLKQFFNSNDLERRQGRTSTSLLQVLKNDLKLSNLKLETAEDLDRIIMLARSNGENWSSVIDKVLNNASEVPTPPPVREEPLHEYNTRSKHMLQRVNYRE